MYTYISISFLLSHKLLINDSYDGRESTSRKDGLINHTSRDLRKNDFLPVQLCAGANNEYGFTSKVGLALACIDFHSETFFGVNLLYVT